MSTQYDAPFTPSTPLLPGMYVRTTLSLSPWRWLDPFGATTLAAAIASWTAWYDALGLGIARVGAVTTPSGADGTVAVVDFHVLPDFVPYSWDGTAGGFADKLSSEGVFNVDELSVVPQASTGLAQGSTSRGATASAAQQQQQQTSIITRIESAVGGATSALLIVGALLVVAVLWWTLGTPRALRGRA